MEMKIVDIREHTIDGEKKYVISLDNGEVLTYHKPISVKSEVKYYVDGKVRKRSMNNLADARDVEVIDKKIDTALHLIKEIQKELDRQQIKTQADLNRWFEKYKDKD